MQLTDYKKRTGGSYRAAGDAGLSYVQDSGKMGSAGPGQGTVYPKHHLDYIKQFTI